MTGFGTRHSTVIVQALALISLIFLLHQEPARAQVSAGPEVAELMGAPVFAADGPEVGAVSAVALQGDGTVREIRVTTASPMGMGTRTVVLPEDRYLLLRGAVVVDFSAAEFDALPNAGGSRR